MPMVAWGRTVSILEMTVDLDLDQVAKRAGKNKKHHSVVQRCIVHPRSKLVFVTRSLMNKLKIKKQRLLRHPLMRMIMLHLKSLMMIKVMLTSCRRNLVMLNSLKDNLKPSKSFLKRKGMHSSCSQLEEANLSAISIFHNFCPV